MQRNVTGGCPAWCVSDHQREGADLHLGSGVELARPEVGTGGCTARLIATADSECEVLVERWIRQDWQVRLPLEAVDTLLDALDDGGECAIQSLASLVADGARRSRTGS